MSSETDKVYVVFDENPEQAFEQHGTVDPTRIDPEWAIERSLEFDRLVDEGEIKQCGSESWEIDTGLRPLLVDLHKAGYPTAYSNIASTGSFDCVEPYITFRESVPRFTTELMQTIHQISPEHRFKPTCSPNSIRLSVPYSPIIRSKESGVLPRESIDIDEAFACPSHHVVSPTFEERICIDRLFIGSIRKVLNNEY